MISAKPEVFSVAPGGYIPVPLIGANGVIESNADRRLTIVVENGELLAFGSANPCTEEQYHIGSFTTYCGLALAIIRASASGYCGRCVWGTARKVFVWRYR